jgi:ElaB/YqjD/DUF883 family membrane-anchored ribosome-binding protein
MIQSIERAKDGVDSMIDQTRDSVVGVANRAERCIESGVERVVDRAHVVGESLRDGAETAARGAHQQLRSTAKAIDRGYRRSSDRLGRGTTAATDYVTENPRRALLLVASAGFVLGMLTRRRRLAAVATSRS